MPGINGRIVRHGAGDYSTADGLFRIWLSSRCNSAEYGCEDRWYVNHRDFDETCSLSGFPRKYHAVEWLKKVYADRKAWACYFTNYEG